MTSIVCVASSEKIFIGADSKTNSAVESTGNKKLLEIGKAQFIAITGPAQYKFHLRHLVRKIMRENNTDKLSGLELAIRRELESISDPEWLIHELMHYFMGELKNRNYLGKPNGDRWGFGGIYASPLGVFSFNDIGYIQRAKSYIAEGSGSKVMLGSLHANLGSWEQHGTNVQNGQVSDTQVEEAVKGAMQATCDIDGYSDKPFHILSIPRQAEYWITTKDFASVFD